MDTITQIIVNTGEIQKMNPIDTTEVTVGHLAGIVERGGGYVGSAVSPDTTYGITFLQKKESCLIQIAKMIDDKRSEILIISVISFTQAGNDQAWRVINGICKNERVAPVLKITDKTPLALVVVADYGRLDDNRDSVLDILAKLLPPLVWAYQAKIRADQAAKIFGKIGESLGGSRIKEIRKTDPGAFGFNQN